MQEPGLADPALFLDENTVHHRDLTGRPAKAQGRDTDPDPEGLAERDAMAVVRVNNRGRYNYRFFRIGSTNFHHVPLLLYVDDGLRIWCHTVLAGRPSVKPPSVGALGVIVHAQRRGNRLALLP